MAEYGAEGADKLKRIREALGRRYKDPSESDRESTTRSELLSYYGPPTDVTAPADQDMWDETTSSSGGGGYTYSDTETVEPLPPPSNVVMVGQASSTRLSTRKPTKGLSYARPDLDPGAYGQGVARSTRVWAMQWIPTISSLGSISGDILVAFARPSKSQSTSLYIYGPHDLSTWENMSSGEGKSLGRLVNGLSSGTPYFETKGEEYRSLHPYVSEDTWIFNSGRLLMWSTPPGRAIDRSISVLSKGYLEELSKLGKKK